MADNKKKRGGADRALIALGEKYEVAYWSKKFKVTPAKLKYAVKKVGHSAKKVEAYIQEQKHKAADKRADCAEPSLRSPLLVEEVQDHAGEAEGRGCGGRAFLEEGRGASEAAEGGEEGCDEAEEGGVSTR